MSISAHTYARAYVEAGAEAQAGKLIATLRKRGDLHKAALVADEVERIITKERGGKMVKVEFARALGVAERAKLLNEFGPKDRVTTTVNPSLIAGVRIEFDGERELDVSLAGKLKNIL
ncbi:MAG TPA: F0F1 ATP synthase subunit delta [Candidatus Paceibacterota bacterium]